MSDEDAKPVQTPEEVQAEFDAKLRAFGQECMDKGFDDGLEEALSALRQQCLVIDPDNESDKIKSLLVNTLAIVVPKYRTLGTIILTALSADVISPTSARGVYLLSIGWRVHAESRCWMVQVT